MQVCPIQKWPGLIAGQNWPIKDAADFLRVSVMTLTRSEIAGRLKIIRIGNRRFLSDADVKRIAAEGIQTTR
jgi:predicted site-specific integrase-resolvase